MKLLVLGYSKASGLRYASKEHGVWLDALTSQGSEILRLRERTVTEIPDLGEHGGDSLIFGPTARHNADDKKHV